MRLTTFVAIAVTVVCEASAQETVTPYATGLLFYEPALYETIPAFAVKDIPQARPASYHISPLPSPLSQGAQGSCVGWAVAYAAKSISNARKFHLSSLIKPTDLFSPSFVYNNIKSGNCNSGTTIPAALEFVQITGAAALADFPYDPSDCSNVGSAQVRNSAKSHVIDNFARVSTAQPISADDLEDMLDLVAAGYPVILGMATPPSFHNFRAQSSTSVLDADDTDVSLGGHAVALVGYSDNARAGLILNSWGSNWGSGGVAWVSYDYLRDTVLESYVMLDE